MKRSAPWRLAAGVIFGLAALGVMVSAHAFATPRIKPPAPGPAYLSQADYDSLSKAASALKKKQYAAAHAQIEAIADPVARSLGQWMYFMAEDPLVSITAADEFLDLHIDWPATNRIQSFVERRIPDNAPADDVLAFFDSRAPISGDGKIQLARALFAKGEKGAGELYLRDAWINDNFTIARERKILSSYGGRLSKADHAARVDRLLWSRQVTNARRIFSRLESSERRKAEARAALLLRAGSGPALYRKLSKDQQLDSGVLHAAVRYYRRTGDEQYAIELASQSPKTPEALRSSREWWQERQLLMRWALKQGRFADAYTAASDHGMEPGSDFAEAEFNAGWIALRFLNSPERAEAHFKALASVVKTPISLSRAYYWLGRSARAREEIELANAYYRSAAQHYYSYYGQLAAEALGGEATEQKFAAPASSTPYDRALFTSRPAVAALRMLADLNLEYEFMVFAYHIDDQLERPGEYVELARLANGEGAPHLTVRAGKVAIQRNAFAPDVAYPLVFVPDEAKRFVSPEIILGLSRQESEFNPRAFSRAGARGVMQLVPTTAQITARKEGLHYSRAALLDDPVYNMTIGSAHLSHLISRFDGSLVLTFAAYNAGANRADKWIEEYGDPRSAGVDPLDWVELIPFNETRNYVQRVLENVQVYRGRLNDAPIPGKLVSDLERGGPRNRVATDNPPSAVLITAAAHFGAQSVSPLPDRTAQRANDYAMQTVDLVNEPQSTPPRPENAAGELSAVRVAEKETPQTIAHEKGDAAASNALSAADAAGTIPVIKPPQADILATDFSAAMPAPAAITIAEPDAGVSAPLPSITLTPDIGERQADLVAASDVHSTTLMTDLPSLPAAAANISQEIVQPDASPMTAVMLTDEDLEDGAVTGDSAMDDCLTYRDFLAQNAEEEAEAADLNAGMLAEFQSSGGACR